MKLNDRHKKIQFLKDIRSGKIKVSDVNNSEPQLVQVEFGSGPDIREWSLYFVDEKEVSVDEFEKMEKLYPSIKKIVFK
jgi:hypothetical protein